MIRCLWAVVAVLTGDVRWRRGLRARIVEHEPRR